MKTLCAFSALAVAGSAMGQLDGQNIGAGLPLLSVQDTATQFGNSSGADQGSPFGSELNSLYGTISGGTLSFSIAGNLEANFNKVFVFIDGVAGGENTLLGDNVDGGFDEINNLGYTFDAGFEPDHGFRMEVGDGFFGVNSFDLIDNTGSTVVSGGGPGDLPLTDGTDGVTTVGWDNANPFGVTDTDASGALTGTTGWEFEVDLLSFLGEVPSEVRIMAVLTNADGGFTSNQVLPGVGGAGNLGGGVDFSAIAGEQFATIVPAPASAALLGLGGLAAA
ncbi:MAG: hypothetical protein AAGF47_11110, partial [Planctomycetota bacterium]